MVKVEQCVFKNEQLWMGIKVRNQNNSLSTSPDPQLLRKPVSTISVFSSIYLHGSIYYACTSLPRFDSTHWLFAMKDGDIAHVGITSTMFSL